MNSERRKNPSAARQVESLEDRVAPSFLGPIGWRAMMRGAATTPAEIQRTPTTPPFRFAPTTPGPSFSPEVNRAPVARFPGQFAPRAPLATQPIARPNLGFIAMRTNPLNNPNAPTPPTNPPATPTNPPATPTEAPAAPLPPKVGGALNTLYQDYVGFRADHPDGNYSPPPNLGFPVVNNEVGVNVHGNGQGDFSTFVGSLQDLGMNVSSSNAVTWTVSGMLPIAELPNVANNPQTLSIAPRYSPVTFGGGAMRF